MAFQLPTAADLTRLAADLGYELKAETAETMQQYFAPFGDSFLYLDEEPDDLPPLQYPERSHRFPSENENPLGAWYVMTEVRGSGEGPLQGKRVAIKDNIFMAGVPLMNGAALMEGFIRDFDASSDDGEVTGSLSRGDIGEPEL